MNRVNVQSSNLRSVGYENGILEVEFRQGSRIYQYYDVPESVYEALVNASSKGKYLRYKIKPYFKCRRI